MTTNKIDPYENATHGRMEVGPKIVANPWSAYFAACEVIRADASRKATDIEHKYADMPASMDVLVMMSRLNRMIGEIATVNAACESALAKVKKPEGVRG